VKKALHVDASVLITVELEESGGAEEVTKLEGEFGGHCEERIVI
jgi:hypothetical protein